MKKNNLKTLVITTIICLLPIVAGVIFYNKVPDKMPIHFDINNNPDNYAPKEMVLFGLPIMMTALHLFIYMFLNKAIKALDENEKKPKVLNVIEWFVPIITITVYTIILTYTLNGKFDVGKIALLIIGILFIILGNYMPKMSCKVGKTAFYPIPKDEKSFKKISKISGYFCFALGLYFLLLLFIG